MSPSLAADRVGRWSRRDWSRLAPASPWSRRAPTTAPSPTAAGRPTCWTPTTSRCRTTGATAPARSTDATRGPIERARVIGGCSAHNGAIAAVGHARDYDGWNLPEWRTDAAAATVRDRARKDAGAHLHRRRGRAVSCPLPRGGGRLRLAHEGGPLRPRRQRLVRPRVGERGRPAALQHRLCLPRSGAVPAQPAHPRPHPRRPRRRHRRRRQRDRLARRPGGPHLGRTRGAVGRRLRHTGDPAAFRYRRSRSAARRWRRAAPRSCPASAPICTTIRQYLPTG